MFARCSSFKMWSDHWCGLFFFMRWWSRKWRWVGLTPDLLLSLTLLPPPTMTKPTHDIFVAAELWGRVPFQSRWSLLMIGEMMTVSLLFQLLRLEQEHIHVRPMFFFQNVV